MLYKDKLKPMDQRGGGGGAAVASTADANEVAKFNKLAEEWWRPDGQFKVVHAFNAARVDYLKRHIAESFARDPDTTRPLAGLKIADIGCGAGLVSEPIAEAGAEVTGIDAAERNVEIARHHAAKTGVEISYRHALPSDLADKAGAFDAVMSLEVVEHVADLDRFLQEIGRLVRPGGILIIGTLNRTPKSFALGIVGAEYVLRLLPRGTHDWRKFVKPSELETKLAPHGFVAERLTGVVMNPLNWRWSLSSDASVNYLQTLRRGPAPVAEVTT